MHGPRHGTRARRAAQAPRLDGRAIGASAASRRASEEPGGGGLRGLLHGLRAGDLDTLLLTVEMAADENRMPCADPEEEARILAFLARLAGHEAALPPSPPPLDGAGTGPEGPRDGTGTEDGAPDPG